MADPISAVAIGATVAGGAMDAFGSLSKGKSQQAMYNYRSGVASLNKKISLQNRDQAFQDGETQAVQQGMKARARMGMITATQGASNLDVNRGSAVDVRNSQSTLDRMDQTQIRSNAARKAYAYEVEAGKYGAEAEMARVAGVNAQKEAKIGAVRSMISTVSSVAGKWYQGNSIGMFGGGASSARHPYDAALDHLYA